jgi:hypothetical protein
MAGLRPAHLLLYLDDIAVIARSNEEMMEKLQDVFNRLRGAKLRIHPKKSRWLVDRVKYLGFIFSPEGMGVDPQKTRIVAEYPVPKTQKKLKSFLAMCSFFRRHLKGFAQKSETRKTSLP